MFFCQSNINFCRKKQSGIKINLHIITPDLKTCPSVFQSKEHAFMSKTNI